jgi:hypothetical protein
MYSVIAASSARVLRWTPRRIYFWVSVANQREVQMKARLLAQPAPRLARC